MKTKFVIIIASITLFGISQPAHAQCRQICDNSSNTALGNYTLYSNTGYGNTAIGAAALYANTTGGSNTAVGWAALYDNSTGSANAALGDQALIYNTTGNNNTAMGHQALSGDPSFNSTGSNNTGVGYQALYSYTTGTSNTATGYGALYSNTIGNSNTAGGVNALFSNTTGVNNSAEGVSALFSNSTGSNNIAVGYGAGSALTTGNNNIDIGNAGVAGESNKIRIGTKGTHKQAFVAGIHGNTIPGGIGVIIGSDGHLGTMTSSARFKEAIKPMDKASEAILDLQPVTFRYKDELDPDSIPQFGLVAEQVEKVNPDLVARDDQGKAYTVRYEAVNAMLLNEFLKEHRVVAEQERKIEGQSRKGQEQDATIAQLKSALAQQQTEITTLTADLKEQASQIQNVSEQLEVSKAAQQMVANNQ